MKKILILYHELMPYNIPVYKELVKMGYELHIVHIDVNKLTPYKAKGLEGVDVKGISTFEDYDDFLNFCISISPSLIFICEGKRKWYWKVGFYFHKRHPQIPILCGSDAQWTGRRNNYLKKYFFRFLYGRCFTHILCAGLWQCVYALKIGFKREQILTPLYSADTELYNKVDIESKNNHYPKRFLYVGQFIERKGLNCLLEAWNGINDKKGWVLTLVGSGVMEQKLKECSDIEVHPFMEQNEICTIMNETGCAIMPSLYEPWGLVLHESAAAALPVIVTKHFGASSQFMINGMNGYIVDEGDVESLRNAMMKIINADIQSLIDMGINSRHLSMRVRPKDVACAIVSTLK